MKSSCMKRISHTPVNQILLGHSVNGTSERKRPVVFATLRPPAASARKSGSRMCLHAFTIILAPAFPLKRIQKLIQRFLLIRTKSEEAIAHNLRFATMHGNRLFQGRGAPVVQIAIAQP